MIPTLWQRLLRLYRMSVATLTPNPSDSLCRSSLLMPLLGGRPWPRGVLSSGQIWFWFRRPTLIVGALLA